MNVVSVILLENITVKTENKLDYSEMTENESCTDFTLHRHGVGLQYNNTVIIIL